MMNIPGAIGGQGYIENTKSVGETIKNVSSNVIGNNNTIFYLINSAEIIWILGIITILMVMIISFIKTSRSVKKDHYIDDEYITDIFEKCRIKTGVNRKIDLVSSKSIKNPSIYGFRHPKILIPELLLQHKDEIEFKYIFMHELVHAKKNHILINILL